MGPECGLTRCSHDELTGAREIHVRRRIVDRQPWHQQIVRARIQAGLSGRRPGMPIALQVDTQASHFFCGARRKDEEREVLSRQDLPLSAMFLSQLLQCLARRLAGDEKCADYQHTRHREAGHCPTTGKISTHHVCSVRSRRFGNLPPATRLHLIFRKCRCIVFALHRQPCWQLDCAETRYPHRCPSPVDKCSRA